ncbi:MAG: hypothetical protein WCI71_00410 [Bacteroidota bacterium]
MKIETEISPWGFLMVLLFAILSPFAGPAQQVEVKNNSFYIDGQKFFVKGIGYEAGAIPGMLPWERTFDPDLLRFDMNRIRAGGFNTIRTWAQFTARELDVIQEYDIKSLWVYGLILRESLRMRHLSIRPGP